MPIQNPRAHLGSAKYVKFADIANKRVTVTIADSSEETMEDGGEVKAVLHFVGKDKGLVLNKGNLGLLIDTFGEDAAGWNGRQVVLYGNPNVMYAGKRTGGIQLEIPAPAAAPAPRSFKTAEAQPAAAWTNEAGQDVNEEPIPF